MKPAFGNRGQAHATAVQHRPDLQSAHLAGHRRAGHAGCDRPRPHGPAPLRAVLAAAAVRRVRRRRNVGVVADDGEVQGRRPLRRHPGVHHAAVLHTGILVRRAGIETPADLKGKRVGVPEYQQTAALWARGALQHEFGVAPKDMEFWMERPPSHSHGGATGFVPPPGVTVNRIPLDKNIGSMMLAAARRRAVLSGGSQSHRPQHRRPLESSRHQDLVSRSAGRRHPTIARPASTPSTMAW